MSDSPSRDPRNIPDKSQSATDATAAVLARVADLIEWRVVPALERIASALEREPHPLGQAAAVVPEPAGRAEALAAIRLAITASRWDQAADLVEEFTRDFPDDPEAARLRTTIDRGRDAAIAELRSRLDASRNVNDPEAVIAFHDDLAVLLRGEARSELEREVVRWLIGLLQRRMRSGTVQPDVVELAARVAERFGSTTEGASVRASLPTLRRSAGQCPRCGGPYTGFEEACPRCLAGPAAPSGEPAAPNSWDVANEDDELVTGPRNDPDDPFV